MRPPSELRARGDTVVTVRHGDSYQQVSDTEYVIAPENGRSSYDALLRDLVRTGHVPDRVAHLALLAVDDKQFRPGSSFFHRNQELGFQSLVFFAQAWSAEGDSATAPCHRCHGWCTTSGSRRPTRLVRAVDGVGPRPG